jgi:phenylpropionate dioxygenase-like ring-hydroxylating dioxygenase large terminal subunit
MAPTSYFSQEFFDLEMRTVLPRSWIFVSDLSPLREPGDFVTEEIGYEPVVVVRDRAGMLRAFSNVCPHRASLLVEHGGNCGRKFECPYHGWTFGLDGRLLGVPHQAGFETPLDKSQLGLRELRLETWEQFVFVNVSGDAPPLRQYLEIIPAQLRNHDLGSLSRVHCIDDEVDANWKIIMDNALCDYHLTFVHGESIGAFIEPSSLSEQIGEYTGQVKTDWDQAHLNATQIKPGLTGDAANGSLAFSVFPNWFIVAFPSGGATVMWWTPLSPQRTRARVWNYSPDPDADPRAQMDQLRAVQEEDYAICRKVQKGLRSSLYRPGPQHELELRIRGYQQRLMRMLADELQGA